MLVAFSVTTNLFPFGLNEICAGSAPMALNGCVEPAKGDNEPLFPIIKPEIFALAKFTTYRLALFENNIQFPKNNLMQKLRVPFLLLLSFCCRYKF